MPTPTGAYFAMCARWLPRLIRAGAIATVASFVSGVPAVTHTKFVDGLVAPVDIQHAGDGSGRLFVVEQRGSIRIVRSGQLRAQSFLDIAALVVSGGERGLLGVAFHPRYASSGRFFVNYTRAGDGATVIAAYRVSAANPDVADAASAQILLTIPQPFANHNGGALRFAPDGYLYIGMGDGGSGNDPGNRAQDRFNLLGKILRIDVDGGFPYAIPASNPFASGAEGSPEIWAVGLRNPWKFAFDRATGVFFVGDVGQDRFEEIHRFDAAAGAGSNLGWRVMEGLHCTGLTGPVPCFDPSLSLPIIEYSHSAGCSVTGGNVYRGEAVPGLAGRYVYGDFCSGRIWSAGQDRSGAWIPREIGSAGMAISAFGEDEAGELYFADYGRGEIRRFTAEPADRVDVIEYYNAALDHFFLTAIPAEIHALDAGTLEGWARTLQSFAAFAQAASGTNPVCRYYLPPAFGDSHFYSASPAECDEVRAKFPGFMFEGAAVLHIALPDTTTGVCATGTLPVHRVWNKRADSNHRYTTDPATRDVMVARGGIAEGYGPNRVIMCAPQ